MPGRRNFFLRLWDAIAHPDKWTAPDVVSEATPSPAPQPAKKAQPVKRQPAKRQPAKRPAKKAPARRPAPAPAPVRTRIVPRNQLPAAWGPNKAALWQEASRRMPNAVATDWRAQALYDAALYTFSEDHETRKAIQDELFRYIRETYGVDFKDIFDWEGYRESYDAVAASHGGDFSSGGDANN